MTATTKALKQAGVLPASGTVFTAAVRCILDRVTVANASGTAGTLAVSVVQSGGAAGTGNQLIPQKALAANETYTCPELAGHTLEAGDSLNVTTTGSTNIVMRISGREVT